MAADGNLAAESLQERSETGAIRSAIRRPAMSSTATTSAKMMSDRKIPEDPCRARSEGAGQVHDIQNYPDDPVEEGNHNPLLGGPKKFICRYG